MVAFLRTFVAVIAAFLFLVFVPIFTLVAVSVLGSTGPREDSWLVVRLSGPLMEWYGPTTLRDLLEDPPPCLMEITENLEKAAVDPNIKGVILRLESMQAGTGKLDEIRAGLQQVRDNGKPIYAYAETLTDGTLYLASECDSTFLSPDGRVRLLGRGVTVQHIKGSLEKLGVQEQFHVIDEYKSAAELFTDKESSPETIDNIRWLVTELDSAYDETVATNRGVSRADLPALRARALLRAEVAHKAGLVDELLHWDELEDRLRGPLEELRTVSSSDYADVDRSALGLSGATKVAVIHGQGFVASDGEDRYDPMWGVVMGVDRVVEDLDRARKDEGVDAILLRWDTPGGATDGAQRVGRAVVRAREEKPVVVSIADEAASGGYMISAPAHRIVCPSNGITGSIGSITGKLNVRGLWEKLGVSFDDLAFAPNAFLDSELHDWTLEQRELVAEEHWAFYRSWVEDIAEARSMPAEKVDEAARGKVWTGRQAKEKGLVDALGGYQEAVLALREVAAIGETERIEFEHWPKEETLMDILVSGDLGRVAVSDWSFHVREAFRSARTSFADPLVLSRTRLP